MGRAAHLLFTRLNARTAEPGGRAGLLRHSRRCPETPHVSGGRRNRRFRPWGPRPGCSELRLPTSAAQLAVQTVPRWSFSTLEQLNGLFAIRDVELFQDR